jgi:hypothetical protein
MKISHPWKARFVVGIIMLVLAFLGMVLTDTRITGGIDYWTWVVPVYAILALWLSWYVKRQNKVLSPVTLVHELLHWTGLILSIFLVSYLVHLGTISRFVAGIFNLTLLALAVFIAGAYLDRMFLLIGLILGIFALLTALLVQYMYAIAIPVAIAGALILGIYFWFLKTKAKTE